MISQDAKASFERIFFHAARTRLAAGNGICEIAPAAVADEPSGKQRNTRVRDADVAVLTISALPFRLLLTLTFRDDDATRDYFAATTQQPLQEAFMEVANLCCGAMNQALIEYFPDLGMSTPYLLGAASIGYLRALAPAHLAAYDVTLGETVRVGATLCICANAPIDFHARDMTAMETGGELELF
ncbi:hypothetical protein [Burkholderia sp.]|uniref:hypothetical protein n=1 Tax=Burkholderia sp. TaxID=36773 RepID=UPI0025B81829|nr:hypothetical protein [Burkholderia sp.]MBS6362505.1 hypothetical protein [Burkholderia sp.]